MLHSQVRDSVGHVARHTGRALIIAVCEYDLLAGETRRNTTVPLGGGATSHGALNYIHLLLPRFTRSLETAGENDLAVAESVL